MTSKKSFNIITVFSCFLLFALVLTCSILAVSDCQVASANSTGGYNTNNYFSNPYFSLGAEKQSLSTNSTVFIKDVTYDRNLGTPSFDGTNFDDSMPRIKVDCLTSASCWLGFWFQSPVVVSNTNYFNICLAGSPSGNYQIRLRTLNWTTYQSQTIYWTASNSLSNYLQYQFELNGALSDQPLMIQVVGPAGVDFFVNWVSIGLSSSSPLFVPPNYYNYGYNQGLDYNFNQGLELIEANSIRNDLSIDNAVSTGNINIPVNNTQLVTSQLSKMEQHTKNTLTIYTPYDILDSGLLYNCLYPVTGQAGWYGAKININLNGIYDFIPANSTFYLDIESAFGVYLSGSTYFKGRNKLFVCFFDSKNQLITLKDNVYSETNFCYNLANYNDLTDYSVVTSGFLNFTADFPTNFEDKALVCWIDTNSTMYFNLPYNVSYIGIFSYFDTDQTYYCYSGKLGYLPSNNYTAGYETGFEAGKVVGLTIGRNRGFQEASDYYDNYGSDYSFMGLMTAVVDAPIKVLGDILDFEIFGYNMKAFLFSVLAIALVLLIVKMFI